MMQVNLTADTLYIPFYCKEYGLPVKLFDADGVLIGLGFDVDPALAATMEEVASVREVLALMGQPDQHITTVSEALQSLLE